MPALKKKATTEQIPLLNVTILSVEFQQKETFEYIEATEAFEKPKLCLKSKSNGKRYDMSLNASNAEKIGDALEELGKPRDTDAIPAGTELTMSVIDTGGSGKFQYGIRIDSIVFPK